MEARRRGAKRKSRFSDVAGEGAPPTKVTVAEGAETETDAAAVERAKAKAAEVAQSLGHQPNAVAVALQQATAKAQAQLYQTQTQAVGGAEQRREAEERYRRGLSQSVLAQIEALRGTNGGATRPAPLLLDAQGRQVDAGGNVVESAVRAKVETIKSNGKSRGKSKSDNPYLSHVVAREDRSTEVDPRLKVRKRETRANKTFQFVKQGTFVKQAEQLREREAKKMLAGFTSGRNPRGYQKESIVSIREEGDEKPVEGVLDMDVPVRPEPVTPDVEWWDIDFIPTEAKGVVDKFGFIKTQARKENPDVVVEFDKMKVKYSGTLNVVEHPARLNTAFKQDNQPVALPLMLTAAERKKIRRQNRQEREKERQDKIAVGLLPPPEPKVKLSNMMRVIGEQAVADPSAIERKVRQQIAQREKNHEMRNLARKLTPEERREKKLRKIKEDAAGDIHVSIFKVADLSNPQHRFKVDVNAQQYHLTGGVLLCKEDGVNMIVVEGGRKALKHYTRLLCNRIHWNGEDQDMSDDDEENGKEQRPGCWLVWQGIVARRSFNNFRFQECSTKITARKVMEAKNVAHYWDLVEKSVSDA